MPGRTDSSAATDSPDAGPPGSDIRTARPAPPAGTAPSASTARLPVERGRRGPARLLPARSPFRSQLRRIGGGRVLEIGCGTGDTLADCAPGSVGVDHDPRSVAHCRERGLTAYTADTFLASPHARPGAFDALLTAHVLEHLDDEQVEGLLRAYVPYVRPGGGVLLITAQEAGHRAGPAPVRFTDFPLLRAFAESAGLTVRRTYSHPLPRPAGMLLRANAFVLLGQVPR
ncbi:class I SAM-dependent methyltransferase [Streptomyces sp. P9-2B-2]|uniref:class I SAM-dependent methyltransferase n=1 Tax=Streptomyces TaxID=1883 RepID=UPI00225649C4|nr:MULTISPECIES: class I SAM-dependent methyltransferase [Streptomyces]MCX4634700.1 class I SAM-dependent methyltransferase [Streptomyces platensis]WJY38573.1 class I SAM-dependent methyltransferase [Streptomyces sp. P9-2B-2]